MRAQCYFENNLLMIVANQAPEQPRNITLATGLLSRWQDELNNARFYV